MKIHVLPGDALTERFGKTNIEGEIIVCRECLVEGDIFAETLREFWEVRAGFIENTYGEGREKYFQHVAGEFEKLTTLAGKDAEINLWFEFELFCQVNLWFTLYLLRESGAKIYRVAPVFEKESDIWKGFGDSSPEDLEKSFAERVEFSEKDILLGADLWQAFQNEDFEKLERLSANESKCFPFLKEVCRAASEKDSRPRRVLEGIIADGKTDFAEIFPEFSAQAGVYGFGDSQVNRILAEI